MGARGKGATRSEPIALGVVTRPHGVRGEVRVHPYNPDSDRLLEVDRVILRSPGGEAREARVEDARRGPKGPVVRLQDVGDRSAAEALRGTELCVLRSDLPEPDDDEWYVVDLVGLRVRDEAGAVVGEVVDVLSYPSVDCLQVRTDDGDREVPMLEPWLQQVDLDAGEVRVAAFHEVPDSPGGRS